MPITPKAEVGKAAYRDMVAALLLFAWAVLRQRGDVDEAAITGKWRELRDSYEPMAH